MFSSLPYYEIPNKAFSETFSQIAKFKLCLHLIVFFLLYAIVLVFHGCHMVNLRAIYEKRILIGSSTVFCISQYALAR